LNLAHRDGSEEPQALEPGAWYDVRVELNAVGWAVPAGHRLRLAISPTYWPHAWPSPEPVRLAVAIGGPSVLELPVRRLGSGEGAKDAPAIGFAEPEESEPVTGSFSGTSSRLRHVTPPRRRHEIFDREAHTTHIESTESIFRVRSQDHYAITEGDPLSALVACAREYSLEREGWSWCVHTESEMICDAGSFRVTNRVEAWEGTQKLFQRSFRARIPRDLL
jgi:hypothetical protein